MVKNAADLDGSIQELLFELFLAHVVNGYLRLRVRDLYWLLLQLLYPVIYQLLLF